MRNKTQSWKSLSPHLFFLPRVNFTPDFSTSFPWAVQWDSDLGLWSVHHTVTPSSSQGGFLTLSLLQCEVTPIEDSPPWTSPPWVLPTGWSSSQTAPVWIHSMGCSPSGTQRASAGPCRVTNPASKPAQVWAPLSTHVHRSRSLL